jgi:uncharacterized protein
MNRYFRIFNLLSLMFVVIAGVNMGFVAIIGFDPLVPMLGGYDTPMTRIIYAVFGFSALWVFYAYLMTPGMDSEHSKEKD